MFFLIAVVYAFFILHWSQPFIVKLGAAIAAAYLGMKAPELFLRNAIVKRRKQLERAFPNALDLMLICVESGMSIELAARKVSQEIGVESMAWRRRWVCSRPRCRFSLNGGRVRESRGRTGFDSDPRAHDVLAQSERYGTPLGAALRVLAQESRDAAHDRCGKEGGGAAADADRADDPVLLPGLFAAILSPAAIQINHWN